MSSEHTQLLQLKRFIKAAADDTANSAVKPLDPSLLSTVVCLVSLNVLARNGCLCNLQETTGELSSLSCNEVSKLAKLLHERARRIAPHSVREVMPEPAPLTKKQHTAFKKFIQTTQSFPLFASESAIGHAYQLCAQSRRKLALKQVQSSNKDVNAEALISFTQLYTPEWVVQTIIDKTVTDRCASDFNVIDPACGGGNFLLPAFERLLRIFLNQGASESEAVKRLAAGALSGVDLDPHAIWITHMALGVRCLRLITPVEILFEGIQLLPTDQGKNLLGTLDRTYDSAPDHPLSKKYNAVITNPPYIGRKLLSRDLKRLLKLHYADDSHDISVAFTRRCLEFLKENGRLGLITQSSILYLPSSKPFREKLIESYNPTLVIEAGTGVFPLQSGEKIDSVIIIIEQKVVSSPSDDHCLFINLRAQKEKAEALAQSLRKPESAPDTYFRPLAGFSRFPNCQFNYSSPQAALTLFEKLPKLENFADVRQGLATTDNDRFVRYVWEVPKEELGKIWFPYVKGAGSKRWYSPILHVVNWENDGQEIKEAVSKAYPYLKGKVHWVVKNEKHYFREGLSFSFVNTQNFAARLMPTGCIFDVAASALFPININRLTLLAFLNSSYAGKMANLINPTINFQVGDVKRLPFITFTDEESEDVQRLAAICVEATENLIKERDFHVVKLLSKASILPGHEGVEGKTRISAQAAFQEHCATVRENDLLLEKTESKIDQSFLQALKAKQILTTNEFEDLENWLLTSPKRTRVEALSERDFAERFICSLAIESDSSQIELSDADRIWLENAIGSSITEWLKDAFAEFQIQQFSAACIDGDALLRNFRALSRSRS